ncbi:uncharacterized protein ACNS7B_009378 [Menidia menidia]
MYLLRLCFPAGLLLSLPLCSWQSCQVGKPQKCLAAEFAPGTNLAGEGFDITRMERKGAFVLNMEEWKLKNGKCTLCKNPFLRGEQQKLPLSVVDWRAKGSCSAQVSSQLFKSSESLLSSIDSSVENNWKVGLGFKTGPSLMLAGTNSKLSKYSMEKTKNDKFSFTSDSISCEYYSYRVHKNHKLHREFRKAVEQLPKVYSQENKEQFYKLIDDFGTHYITKVKLGGSVESVTSIRQCQASLQGLSVEEVQTCLKAEASITINAAAAVELSHCKKDIDKSESKLAFSSRFSDRSTEIKGGLNTEPDLLFSAKKNSSAYSGWLKSLPQNPDIISYSLESLHELFPKNTTRSSGLRSAISHYILEKGLWRNCSERCRAGIRTDSKDPCVCQCHNQPAVNRDCCPTQRGSARVVITAERATGLWGDYFTSTDGYVKVFFNGMEYRSKVIYNNNNPRWDMAVDLGSQVLSQQTKVKFQVWDRDNNWDDDNLGECEKVLSAGTDGDFCNLNHGVLYFKWEVTCAPSLTGTLCERYQESPMSQSLRKFYVSRHAHPIPKAILKEMGVFVTDKGQVYNMLLLNLCVVASFLLCLPQRTHGLCSQGTPRQCQEAEFAPGSTLAGEGFDITKMVRKGAFLLDMNKWQHKDKTCTLCSNPYLEGKKQKLPLSVVDWRAKQSCSAKVSTKLHKSSESLVSSSSNSIENDWKTGLEVNVGENSGSLMLAGTHSRLADYSMGKTKNDKFSFTSNGMSCDFYSYRVSSTPKLHREFRTAVKQLPKVYKPEFKQRFYKLIDNFGTHYITKVKLGGSIESVTSIRQCETSLEGLSAEEVQMCLEAEASASIKVSVRAEAKHCQKNSDKREDKKSFSDLFNDRFTEIRGGHTTEPDLLFSANKDPSAYKEWLNTLPQNPDIISYSLDSLHELLPTGNPARKNLRAAISHYILERGLWRNCSGRCLAGVRSQSGDPCVCQCHNEPAVNRDCCPTRKGVARVVLTVQRGAGLWGDHTTATDGYVKVSFAGQLVQRTPVIQNSNDPHWGTIVDLGLQDVSANPIVRFEVWDQDSNWDDDLLGECQTALSAGGREDLCALQHGRLYYKWEVKCAPGLGGDQCTDYKPSPMGHSLRGLYTSRHAHPVPKAILLKMGVFLDGGTSGRNQSVTAE